MDLLAYLRILRRRWPLIVAVALAGATFGAVTGLLNRTSEESGTYYRATHVLFFDPTANATRSSAFSNLDQIALLTVSGDVPRRVGSELGQDGRVLSTHVIVTVNSVTATLEITAAATSPREAEQIADGFAEQLQASITEREEARFEQTRDRVVQRLDDVQAQLDELDARFFAAAPSARELIQAQRSAIVNQYRLTYEQFQQLAEGGSPSPPLSSLETAEAAPIGASEYDSRIRQGELGDNIVRPDVDTGGSSIASPSSTFDGPMSRGVLGGMLGLLGGVGLALVAERLDRRLRSRHEIEEAYGLPVLAEVPRLTELEQRNAAVVSFTEPLSRTAESHRTVRSSLLFQHSSDLPHGIDDDGAAVPDAGFLDPEESTGGKPLVVLVSSAVPGEGKSTTSANLAAVFAETGDSVLAVNCDFRRPTLHHLLGAPDEARRVLETSIPGVKLVSRVVSDPHANPSKIIAAQRRVIEAARDRFDVVVLDTAPLLTTNDAIEVITSVDLVLIVARCDVTTSDSAERVREILARVRAPVAGIVVVGDESVQSDPYYYYSRQSGQEPVEPDDGEPATTDPEPAGDADATEGFFGDEEPAVGEGIANVEVSDDDELESSTSSKKAKRTRRLRGKAAGKSSKRSP